MRFEEYVKTSGPSLLRYTYLLTGSAHTAEDIAQATLVKVYRNWTSASQTQNIDAYVRRVATNTFIDTTRRRSFHEQPNSDVMKRAQRASPDHGNQIADRDDLRERLESLGRQARAILVMRYYADMDDPEIAEVLAISPSTVRATASRALQTLRQQVTAQPLRGTQ